MKRLRIEVPATSANLGPGFDCLGMALDLVDVVEVELDPGSREVQLTDLSGADREIDHLDNLLCHAYRAWEADVGTELPGARFKVECSIPIGKGFGSSAAAIVAGLAAGAAASEDKNPRERIVRLATRLEGHPDNVVPATLGGITACFCDGDSVRTIQVVTHLALGIALFVPDDPLATRKARAVLPEAVPLADAVFNLGRVAFLVTALQWGRWDEIGPAMEDRLHQPYRSQLVPALDDVILAAREGGAYGAALSGAGPSVIALGPLDRREEFGAAMERRAREKDWPGKRIDTGIRALGVTAKEIRDEQ